jgi:recombinational DNA repair ATPase RecF
MKVTKLTIKNIGLIKDTAIELNKPLILFYGEIMQGKTTILNAVKYCFGGEFPADIIRHGAKEARVELAFDGGSISREWYRGKDQKVRARAITFIRGGKAVQKPVDELKKFLNPFLLDQDHLRNMTELERKRFFVDLFNVDTSELDSQIAQAASKASQLRAKVAGYGDIDLTEVKPVDATKLRADLQAMREKDAAARAEWDKACGEIDRRHSEAILKWQQELTETSTHNDRRSAKQRDILDLDETIARLQRELTAAQAKKAECEAYLAASPPRTAPTRPEPPAKPAPPEPSDTSILEAEISEAAATNVRAEQYQANKRRDDQRKADEREILNLEHQQRDAKEKKIALLKGIGEHCKIKGLEFDEEGNFTYGGTSAGMLSTAQIMTLSSELSAMYPEGLGISLLDRAESLGKSIFGFISRAEAEQTTILATIVGEKPADVPENVGVFVVEGGKVK